MSDINNALARLDGSNTEPYSTGNPFGLTGRGAMVANWVPGLRAVATLYRAMAALYNSLNFVGEKAAVATILQRCQELVAQITPGSTAALAFPSVDRALVTAADVVDVFVYDTRLDARLPDGGRWNEPGRCAGTSWWHEPLNTVRRGARRDFPAVAAIVARTSGVTIYDALDLDPVTGAPRMWMVIAGNSVGIPVRVFALNGTIYVATANGLRTVEFLADRLTNRNGADWRIYPDNIANRNTNVVHGAVLAPVPIAASAVNGVHARVLPGAPLDAAGMPIPTVAVTTSAGAAVIHPTGQVCHITNGSAAYATGVLLPGGYLALTYASTINGDGQGEIHRLPYTSVSAVPTRLALIGAGGDVPFYLGSIFGTAGPFLAHLGGNRLAMAHARGLGIYDLSHERYADSMLAVVTAEWATGWMAGDTCLATLCDAATGSITGGTVVDRSGKNNPLTVHGTLSRTAIATGSDVVSWSGFSSLNYIEQPHTADLDFGTGDFSIFGWAVPGAGGTVNTVVMRAAPDMAGAGLWLFLNNTTLTARLTDDGWATVDELVGHGSENRLLLYMVVRRAGKLELWIDGLLAHSIAVTAAAGSLSNAAATLRIGMRQDGQSVGASSVSMLRVAAYALTPAQIRRMYEDERPLFSEGAKCLLGGTSSAVASLDRDPLTGRLAVGTGDGVSVFQGLRRVSYYEADVLAATTSDTVRSVALRGGNLLIGTSAEVGFVSEAIGGKEAIAVGGPRPVGGGFTTRGVTTDATPLDLAPRVLVGERETVMIEARIVGRVTGAADTERLTYIRRGTYYRDAGGTITLQGSVQTEGADTEITGTADATLAITGDWVSARVTGVTGKRIRWEATFTVTRISEENSYAA